MRGMHGIIADGLSGLHDLQIGGSRCCICQRGWGWLFWLVWMWCNERWSLRADGKMQHTGALMLRFIITCGGSGIGENGQGRVGTVTIRGVRVIAAAVPICYVGVECPSGVNEADHGVQDALAVAAVDVDIGSVGVEDAIAATAVGVSFGIVVSAVVVSAAGSARGVNGQGGVGAAVSAAGIAVGDSVGVGIEGAGNVDDAVAAAAIGVVNIAATVAKCVGGMGGTDHANVVAWSTFAVAAVGGDSVEGASNVKDVGGLDGIAAADAVIDISIGTDGVGVTATGGASSGNEQGAVGDSDNAGIAVAAADIVVTSVGVGVIIAGMRGDVSTEAKIAGGGSMGGSGEGSSGERGSGNGAGTVTVVAAMGVGLSSGAGCAVAAAVTVIVAPWAVLGFDVIAGDALAIAPFDVDVGGVELASQCGIVHEGNSRSGNLYIEQSLHHCQWP